MTPQATVREHRRDVEVDGNGIATVKVKLQGYSSKKPLVLATVGPPYTNVKFDDFARTIAGVKVLVDRSEASRRTRVAAIHSNAFEGIQTLEWSFRASNMYPFRMRDLVVPKADFYERGTDESAGRACVLYVPSDTLIQTVRFAAPDDALLQVMNASMVEEQRHPRWHHVGYDWTQVPAGDRIVELVDGCFSATYDRPVVGRRYAIKFRPKLASSLSALSVEKAKWREACRLLPDLDRLRIRGDTPATTLRAEFLEGIEQQLQEHFRTRRGQAPLDWTIKAFVWDTEHGDLRNTFGRFTLPHWGQRFEYGEGVVGHAFRFGSAATYHKHLNSSLICEDERLSWIVCLPLLDRLDGSCIGVVSFAGDRHPEDRIGRGLHDLAQTTAVLTPHAAQCRCEVCKTHSALSTMTWRINCAFWRTLQKAEFLTEERRTIATQHFESWNNNPGAISGSTRRAETSSQPTLDRAPRRGMAGEVKAAWIAGVFAVIASILGAYSTRLFEKRDETVLSAGSREDSDLLRQAQLTLRCSRDERAAASKGWMLLKVLQVVKTATGVAAPTFLEVDEATWRAACQEAPVCTLHLKACSGAPTRSWSSLTQNNEPPRCDVREVASPR